MKPLGFDFLKAGGFAAAIALCSLLIFAGCRNPVSAPDAAISATGTLVIVEPGQARAAGIVPATITPEWPTDVAFHLELISTTRGASYNRSESWDGESPVVLYTGGWALYLTAYIPGTDNRLYLSKSNRLEFSINPNAQTRKEVSLYPVDAGQGTFRWDISFSRYVHRAQMQILRDDGAQAGTETTLAVPNATGEQTLDVGIYRVAFRLYNASGEAATVISVLRVYQNMVSKFADEDGRFENFIFPDRVLSLILSRWDGTRWNLEGVSPGYFGLLEGIYGIDATTSGADFTALAGWFNRLSAPGPAPYEAGRLPALIDAALVGIAANSAGFFATGALDRRTVEQSIRNIARPNATEISSFYWDNHAVTHGDRVFVGVGGYQVEVTLDEPVVPLFAVNFETYGGSNIPPQAAREGQSVRRPPPPIRVGHHFDGWVSAGGAPFDFAAPVTGYLSVHARWRQGQGVVQVSAGYAHTMGIRADGSLWGWGNRNSILGDGFTDFINPVQTTPVRVGADSYWTAVSAGRRYTVGIRADGSLWAWGDNEQGQLGDGTTTQRIVPARIGAEDYCWVAVSAGVEHTVGIQADGSLWAWGNRNHGRLGDGFTGTAGTNNQSTPIRVGTDYDWVAVSAGYTHTMGIRADGSLWGWGNRAHGRLGEGPTGWTQNQTTPIRVGTDYDWVAVSAGTDTDLITGTGHTMGIRAAGSLWGWGNRSHGRLGDGSTTPLSQATPIRVGTASDWVAVSAGVSHTMGIRADGSLWGWGNRAHGRIGDGFTGTSASTQATPTRIGTASDWVAVSAGGMHTMGIRAGGLLWAWGWNGQGRLGEGTTTSRSMPIPVNPAVWQ